MLADSVTLCRADNAAKLGITPDQYVWLRDRLTDQEFRVLTEEAMHQLLASEYTEYPYRAVAERAG